MIETSTCRSLRLILFFASISLQFCPGLSDASPGSEHSETHSSEKMGTRGVAIALLGVGAAVLFAFFLYKLWQKKKRNEQYARLMKLFEEDDELRLFEEDDELKLFETDDELLGPRV